MKNTVLFLFFLGVVFGCSKDTEEVGTLRIIGSNTSFNAFANTTDGEPLLLTKNQYYFLSDPNVANLNLKASVPDSTDMERVFGKRDSLVVLTKNGFVAHFGNKKTTLKNYDFTICDQAALIDSFLVVAKGGTECLPSLGPRMGLYVIDKKGQLSFLTELAADKIVDIQVLEKKIFTLTAAGALKVYEVKANKIEPVSEYQASKITSFNIMHKVRKIVAKTQIGWVQLSVKPDFSFSLINQATL
jgi:hypothetical protein